MQTAIQSQSKPSENSSNLNKIRERILQNNLQKTQASQQIPADYPSGFHFNLQQKSFSDNLQEGQKCSNSSCSTSKKSAQQMKDSQIKNEKINANKLQSQIIEMEKIQHSNKYHNINVETKKKMKEEDNIAKLKAQLYGKRIFIGKGGSSIGQQGKQSMIAFLGLFIPIVLFLLFEVQYSQGLRSHSTGDAWIISVIISILLCLILFFYSSLSNPGFIAVPLSQKQRHALPVVQQKGKKEFDLRYCYTCHIYRPLRTHHCKICDLCVIERDHHCPFLNNCIGYYNRRAYVYFLMFTVITELLIIAETLFQIVYPFIEDEDFVITIQRIPVILAIIQCIYASILAANILSLFIFQLQLIARNRTTDEFRRLIVPDPKPIDIELNKEFDYGCLSNFNHALFCTHPPEKIYSNFCKISKEYLISRYEYYKRKSLKRKQENGDDEEDEEEQHIQKYSKKNKFNQPNHTQQPLQEDITNKNQQVSIQSRPSLSPIKLKFSQTNLPKFFPDSKNGVTQSNQQQLSNFGLNDNLEKDKSVTAKGKDQFSINNGNKINNNAIQNIYDNIYSSPILQNDQISKISSSNQGNKNISTNNNSQISSIQNYNSLYSQNQNIILPSQPKLQAQKSSNLPQTPTLISQNSKNQYNSGLKQYSQDSQNKKEIQSQQQRNKTLQNDLISQGSNKNYYTQEMIPVIRKEENENKNINPFVSPKFPQYPQGFSNNNQGFDNLTSGRLLRTMDQKESEQVEQISFNPKQMQNSLSHSQGPQDLDQNFILYDIKLMENNAANSKIPKKSTTGSTSLSKSQYYSSKISDSQQNQNSNNGLINASIIVSADTTVNRNTQKKDSINGYSRKIEQSINLNSEDYEDGQYDDNINFDNPNNSYIEQKPNDFTQIKSLQNNNNSNQRRFNGIKKFESQLFNANSPISAAQESSPTFLQSQIIPQQKSLSQQENDNKISMQYQSDNQPDLSLATIAQLYPDKENGERKHKKFQKNDSIHKYNSYNSNNNNNKNNNNTDNNIDSNSNSKFNNTFLIKERQRNQKSVYFDPSQEQSTDLPNTINDNQNQQYESEKLPPNIISNEIDDFNIEQEQNILKQKDPQKRVRKLFQNIQKLQIDKSDDNSQTNSNNNNNINNSSFMTNELYSNDNFKPTQNNNPYYDKINNSKIKLTISNQIQMQPQSKDFRQSPNYSSSLNYNLNGIGSN